MKRLLNIIGSLLGLLVLGALVVVLALSLEGVRRTGPVSGVFQSPFRSPIETSTPRPTLRPTSTRPPEPPTRTPTPTFTPAPPTPTPKPLPTLIPGLPTFFYVTTGKRYPEIYRAQLNPASRMVEPVYLVHTPELWHSRTYVFQLYPSPDGKRVAVAWAYGEVSGFVSILSVDDGRFTPLFSKEAEMSQEVIFLDWSPDGRDILALVGGGNPDLGWGVWLVDVRSREYSEIEAIERTVGPAISGASFSPDGKVIVYAKSDCYQCGSEVWRLALDGSDRQLLFQVPEFKVEDVLWSPDGRHIAFTQWRESTNFHDFAPGELWVMRADGSERHLLSPAVIGHYKNFIPVWSQDGRQIAFIKGSGFGKELEGLSGNAYVVDIKSGEIRQLTSFQNAQVLGPAWSPDSSTVTFAVRQEVSSERFEPWAAAADARGLRRLDERAALVLDSRKSNPIVVWLPTSAGGERQ